MDILEIAKNIRTEEQKLVLEIATELNLKEDLVKSVIDIYRRKMNVMMTNVLGSRSETEEQDKS